MPRKRRVHFQNAIYHVMMRGNYQQNIFTESQDRDDFYLLLEKATVRYSCKIHLFCLMTNHIHIVIEVSQIPLSKVMQFLTASYAKLHNKRNKRTGHLFQGRYKAKIVANDAYLRELCYYIHYNPIKAGMVKNINDYEWSSHHCYLNQKNLNWVTTDLVLKLLQTPNNTNNDYSDFINDISHEYRDRNHQYCQFNPNGELIIGESLLAEKINTNSTDLKELKLGEIINAVCHFMNVKLEDLDSCSQVRHLSLCRATIAYFAHYYCGFLIVDLAVLFHRTPHTVSRLMHTLISKAQKDQHIQEHLKRVERQLVLLNTTS